MLILAIAVTIGYLTIGLVLALVFAADRRREGREDIERLDLVVFALIWPAALVWRGHYRPPTV